MARKHTKGEKVTRPKRLNGEGSYRQLADGRWSFKRLVQDPDGRAVWVKAEGKTLAIARDRCKAKVKAIQAGVVQGGRSVTVGEQLEAWYRDTYLPGAQNNGPRTYRSLLDNHLLPQLGTIKLADLKTPRCRQWFAERVAAGLAPKTIGLIRSIIIRALDQAVEDGRIPANPFLRSIKLARADRAAPKKGKALSDAQARQLLDAARGHRLELAIRLALGLGLRRGEAAGLRWQDVDFAAGTLTINGQLVDGQGGPPQWSDYTKTPAARRTIRLPAVLLSALRWQQTRQAGEHHAAGWPPSLHVFSSARNGGPLPPHSLYNAFKDIARSVGLGDFRLHDLRHSAASFLLAEGVKLKRVAAILGHARTSTTLDTYGHLIEGDDADATERVARRLGDDPAPTDTAGEVAS